MNSTTTVHEYLMNTRVDSDYVDSWKRLLIRSENLPLREKIAQLINWGDLTGRSEEDIAKPLLTGLWILHYGVAGDQEGGFTLKAELGYASGNSDLNPRIQEVCQELRSCFVDAMKSIVV